MKKIKINAYHFQNKLKMQQNQKKAKLVVKKNRLQKRPKHA